MDAICTYCDAHVLGECRCGCDTFCPRCGCDVCNRPGYDAAPMPREEQDALIDACARQALVECGNCDWRGAASKLHPLNDADRAALAGERQEDHPAGCCPQCLSFCFPAGEDRSGGGSGLEPADMMRGR